MKNANQTPVRVVARFALLTGDLFFAAMQTTDAAWAAMTPRDRRTTRQTLLAAGVVRLLKAEAASGARRAVEVGLAIAQQVVRDPFVDSMQVGEAVCAGDATVVRFA